MADSIDIAEALAETFGAVDGLNRAFPYEPLAISRPPVVAIWWDGFQRAGLETNDLSGTPLRDEIGSRTWVWNFITRLWVSLGSDEEASQNEAQSLTKSIVLALEADKSLGGLAVDSAITSGRPEIWRPRPGSGKNTLLTVAMATQVETREAA